MAFPGKLATVLLLFASVAPAQRVISANAGIVAYRIGSVLVDNQPVQVPYQMRAGETLRTTGNSVVELLLLPSVFLRLDENSSFRMEDTQLADAQVEILTGSVFFEVRKMDKGSRLRVHFRGNVIEFRGPGKYQLDARRGGLRVFDGEAFAARQDKAVNAKRGKVVDLAGDLAVSNFDPKELGTLTSWAAQRTGLRPAAAQPQTTLPEGLTFSGNLEKITLDSISIRLSDGNIVNAGIRVDAGQTDDGLPEHLEKVVLDANSVRHFDGIIIEARLPPTGALSGVQLSDGRHVGDRVQITCTRIQPVYEPRARLMRYLELRKLEIREEHPAPEELDKALESRVWRESGNLLKPPRDATVQSTGRSTIDPQGLLQRARMATSRSAAQMVNFMADETAIRYRSPTAGPQWQRADTIKSEVRPATELHQHIVKDGTPWTQPFEALPGFKWYDGSGAAFGAQTAPFITAMNSVPCPTVIELEGRQTLRGKPVVVYRYSSPPDGCLHYLYWNFQRLYSGFTGRMFFDESTLEMLRFEEKAVGLPTAFGFTRADKEVDWDHVKVGDMTYLLPISASFTAQLAQEDAWLVKIEYKNHRHYEASSAIKFQ